MNITFSLLLLTLGGLTLWLLIESKIRWYLKLVCISLFCLMSVVHWSSLSTFLGHPAHAEDIAERVRIHWVVINEPAKLIDDPGAIYVLVESPTVPQNWIKKVFGYKVTHIAPRLFGLPYNRELHEELAKNVIPALKNGQPVYGSLSKENSKGNAKEGAKTNKKGGGSESQKQEWVFHLLRPSDFLAKPTD